MTGPTRAYGYLRVSSADQVDGFSLETQQRIITDHCARMGWELARLYIEAGKSAYSELIEKRPKFRQMLDDAAAGGCEMVVCYQYDRFARWASVALEALDRLKRARVRLTSVTEPFDPASAFGKLQYTQMAGWSEYYSSALSERLIRVNEVRRAKGQKLGALHYGARRDANGREEVDPAWAGYLRRVLELAATMSGDQARIILNAEGVPTRKGNPWHPTSVRHLVVCGGWLASQPEPWPSLWHAAMARRGSPSVRAGRATRDLTGLMRCGVCGGGLYYGPRNGKNKQIGLQCRRAPSGPNRCLPGGPRKTYAAHYEALVAEWVAALPHDVDLLRRAAVRLAAVDDPARLEMAAIEEERRMLRVQHNARIINDAELTVAGALLAERERAVAPSLSRDTAYAAEIAAMVPRFASVSLPAGRNIILRALIDHVVITGRDIEIFPTQDFGALLTVAKELAQAA